MIMVPMVCWRTRWDLGKLYKLLGTIFNPQFFFIVFTINHITEYCLPTLCHSIFITSSLLAYLRESRGVRGPHLVIVPKSVAGNWIKEIKKWCPSIKAIRMMGNKDDRKRVTTEELPPDPKTGKRKWDVLVTSYEGILKEQKVLQRIN